MAWSSNTYLTQLPIFFALCLIFFCGQHAFATGNGIAENAALSSKKIHEEEDEIGYIQSLVVKLPAVLSIESSYQEIEVYDSHHFGRVFILDGCLQLTERDAHHYNEMLAHVPVMEYLARRDKVELGEPLKVLVLGGGDGYVVSELLKHPHVGSIDHVELDKEVITVAQQHLPWGDAWKSEKVNLVIADGAAFVKEQANKGKSYHVVVQDASDPFYLDADGSVVSLPSSVLYSTSHFESLHGLLQPNEGVLMFQAETYNIPSNLESIHKWRKILEDVGFASPRYGTISIGTYPTGQIGFFAAHARDGGGRGNACKLGDTCRDASGTDALDGVVSSLGMDWDRVSDQFGALGGTTRYYHPRIHRSSFDLPRWVEEYIYGDIAGPHIER